MCELFSLSTSKGYLTENHRGCYYKGTSAHKEPKICVLVWYITGDSGVFILFSFQSEIKVWGGVVSGDFF